MSSCWGAPAVKRSAASRMQCEELLSCRGAVGLGEEWLGGGDHAVFAPFLVVRVHGFGDAVGEGEEDVAGLQENGGTPVYGVGEQADDGAGGFEGDGSRVPRRT